MSDKVEKKLSASLLPVAVEEEEEKKKKAAAPFPAVQLVSQWALLTAGFFIVFFALAYALPPPSWARLMTDAEVAPDAEETAAAIWRGVAWCTAAQSAITALTALLPGNRRLRSRSRRALAYIALAASAANHVMFASGIALVVTTAGADSGPWYWIIGGAASVVVMLAAGDLVGFLALTGWLD